MDLRQLESFVAVAVEQHFGRAAERLDIAQSPLSRRIALLEADLGVRLLERTNRHVALTEAGRAVVEEARATLARAEATRRAAARAARGETGTLRVGYVASAAFDALPRTLRAARAGAPQLRFELHRLNSAAQRTALAEDRIDVGLARTIEPTDEVAVEHLAPDPLVAAVPAGQEPPVPELAALADREWILVRASQRSKLNARILAACARAGFQPRAVHDVPDQPTVVGLVAGGLGVSLVPAALTALRVPGVVFVALTDAGAAALELTLVWHTRRAGPLVERFLAAAREQLAGA
jgi:DNA-binding transcriptional LysR family regulator